MANNVKNENNTQVQGTEEIKETGLIEVKEPWWKTGLKILGYVASAAAGVVTGLVIGSHMGDDEDKPEETTNE